MAGVVLENGNNVWSKVKNHLSHFNANPASQKAFEGLKAWLAQQKKNPDLQFIPFSSEQIIASGGYQPLAAGACTVYGVYAKGRRTTATTASFVQVFDAATNASGTILAAGQFNLTGQEWVYIQGKGIAVATELTIAADTTIEGQTESTAALSADGFIVVGA